MGTFQFLSTASSNILTSLGNITKLDYATNAYPTAARSSVASLETGSTNAPTMQISQHGTELSCFLRCARFVFEIVILLLAGCSNPDLRFSAARVASPPSPAGASCLSR